MALPRQLPTDAGPPTSHQQSGPFVFGGEVYVLIRDLVASDAKIYHSADPDASAFTELDSANNPVAVTDPLVCGFNDGTVIHIATNVSDGSTNQDPLYSQFTLASETYAITDENAGNNQHDSDNSVGPQLMVRGTGDPVLYFHSEIATDMGTPYSNYNLLTRDSAAGAGNWTNQGRITQDAAVNYQWGHAIIGASDRVHFMFTDWTVQDLKHVTWTSADALGTEQVVDAVGVLGAHGYNFGISYDVSGTVHIRFAYTNFDGGAGNENISIAKADSADDPTWSVEDVNADGELDDINSRACVVADPTTSSTIHVIFKQTTAEIVAFHTQVDTESTWTAEGTFLDWEETPVNAGQVPQALGFTTVASRSDVCPVLVGGSSGFTYYYEATLPAGDTSDIEAASRFTGVDIVPTRTRMPNLAGMIPGCDKGDEEIV